ncbi:MAG: glycosyltransferase family 2 protein [Gallionella sp.]|nr:glycosyltransferase family 2 protein [Gallionella sp.]
MLDVTVCIMSYNRPAYLREALRSVLTQTKQPKRIVIYDNGSDSGVFESVKEFVGKGVEWVGAEVNHPFIWNFSRAMFSSETRYIMMLHDDDRLCTNFLETQIGLLEANASLVAVSCNGYFIDETGKKTGGTLVSTVGGEPVELYTCSGQVALKYAGNSCIPFSPTVYRSEVARSIKFREGFDKVCDAVYFCDLAEIGSIAYQTAPLYECRVHSGQDSSYFPYDLMNQLEEFFWSRRCVNDSERAKLHNLLVWQHTARNLKQIFQSVRKGDLSPAASLLMDDKFRFVDAAKVIGAWGRKNVLRKW